MSVLAEPEQIHSQHFCINEMVGTDGANARERMLSTSSVQRLILRAYPKSLP